MASRIFTDGDGFTWDLYDNPFAGSFGSSISDGTNDSFDEGFVLSVNGTAFFGTFGADELAGRQAVLTGTIGTVAVARRVYVTDAVGEGWARFLESFTNTSGSTQTITVNIATNSGADSGFQILGTSSSDNTLGTNDFWIESDDSSLGSGDPANLQVFGDGRLAPTSVSTTVFTSAGDQGISYTYTLTIQPGATVSILSFASQQNDLAGLETERPTLLQPDQTALFGLTSAQLASVANFGFNAPPPSGGNNGSGSGGGFIPGAFYGTEGPDTIIAQSPGAILVGNGGNDTYLVNDSRDVVTEINGGGTDIVYTTVSYNLGSNEVEALSTVQQTDTTPLNLIGNFVGQTIVGNYGNNLLNGGGGADTLIGLFGNDTYAVGDSRIVIQEQDGQGADTVVTSVGYTLAAGVSVELLAVQDRASTASLNLTGNALAQTIAGGDGANRIDGGAGSDTMIGFGGADTFAFSTALGSSNVDTIVDFTVGSDRIELSSAIFTGLAVGTLTASSFSTGAASGSAAQILYNAATGALSFDADGAGAGAAVQFAAISPGLALTAASLTVV